MGGRPERERLVGRRPALPSPRLRPHAPCARPAELSDTTFHFVTDGIESALDQARAAAGAKDVVVAGGAEAGRQYLAAGLLDEMQVHVAPILLGDGTRLFEDASGELELVRTIASPAVTHLRYRVVR